MTVEEINKQIAGLSEEERNNVSDGYHTFGELYEHRCGLYRAFANLSAYYNPDKWKKSQKHFDGTSRDGRFILQGYIALHQISYHLPMKHRHNLDNVRSVEKADERDGHTSQDVLDRLIFV